MITRMMTNSSHAISACTLVKILNQTARIRTLKIYQLHIVACMSHAPPHSLLRSTISGTLQHLAFDRVNFWGMERECELFVRAHPLITSLHLSWDCGLRFLADSITEQYLPKLRSLTYAFPRLEDDNAATAGRLPFPYTHGVHTLKLLGVSSSHWGAVRRIVEDADASLQTLVLKLTEHGRGACSTK